MIDRLQGRLAEWSSVALAEEAERETIARKVLESAEELVSVSDTPAEGQRVLKQFLNVTGHYRFLTALGDPASRFRWAEIANKAILRSQYSLLDMFGRSLERHPDRPLFQVVDQSAVQNYSYRMIDERLRSIAATFLDMAQSPRVAIISNNSLDSALCDLACLLYGILVTPLNIHQGTETLAWILDDLKINIVVTDSSTTWEQLEQTRRSGLKDLRVLAVAPLASDPNYTCERLGEAELGVPTDRVSTLIESRPRRQLEDVVTVMFTSGSTGRPKGICFSEFNLVSKRFSRAAALPTVGDREVLICFLPLFHTFGRYFEMLGCVYWSGTYVFPGNPSADTLLSLLPQINPTGLISIPLRWQQIRENCRKRMADGTDREDKTLLFRDVVGARLRWGLSAAGYLPPQTFRFFNQYGVDFCSGFGMTEGTGGITMTPPGDYRDNSIGVPLPGIQARRSDRGELQISGAYVARYLEDVRPGGTIQAEPTDEDRYWLPTGDIFRELDDGHLEIVDRLKDIYKNNRGQTIAPRRVEKKYDGVPGIKRVFLVGDARAYNTLLIVPDADDPVMMGFSKPGALDDYYRQIVANANQDLAPYERVINFTVVERDFDADRSELTPKGSFRRKVIEENFATDISALYKDKYVTHQLSDISIRIPHWFFRDLGVLASDIDLGSEGLVDSYRHRALHVCTEDEGWYRIGDLSYKLSGNVIDLGVLSRLPGLWLGNPELIAFCPCREGWDLPVPQISSQARLITNGEARGNLPKADVAFIQDIRLSEANALLVDALFGSVDRSLPAVETLGERLRQYDDRLRQVIQYRLESLARHPEFAVRSKAYQILLLDEPNKDYGRALPAFISSGLPFLDDEAIHDLASEKLSRRRLEALRQRLVTYRAQLSWPADTPTRQQFAHILKLLADFARYHTEFYDTVRAELASWIVHRVDPELSTIAQELFIDLWRYYEEHLAADTTEFADTDWDKLIVFADELSRDEQKRLRRILGDRTFLRQSVVLAFDNDSFKVDQIIPCGIWVTKIVARHLHLRYRVSINTKSGTHYDLQLILSEDIKQSRELETVYWLMAISGYPHGHRVLPRLGCCRPELGVRSLAYFGDLTLWERIREFTSHRQDSERVPRSDIWSKLFTRGLGAILRAWRISGQQIIPGHISPENVVVPDQDFREGSIVASLAGWCFYGGPLSLVEPMLQNFYRRTAALYPWCRESLKERWILDAFVRELGVSQARQFLEELQSEIENSNSSIVGDEFRRELDQFLERLDNTYFVPLTLNNTIDRYHEWLESTPGATHEAQDQMLGELYRLYRLDRLGEIGRYYLYRHTYFNEASLATHQAFDLLLGRMYRHPKTPALNMVELSQLQATISDTEDRHVFRRLIFPRSAEPRELEIIAVGESEEKQVIVRTEIVDRQGEAYTLREPIEPSEIGQLYRQFFRAGYPKTITDRDRFLVLIDDDEQIVGGLCYRLDADEVVHLDGTSIGPSLSGRGLGTALLEDFCVRMTNAGMRVIKTHFYMRAFFARRGFEVDERWGALVRFLQSEDIRKKDRDADPAVS